MTRDELLDIMRDVDCLPDGGHHRTIYEAGEGPRLEPSGRFHIDYATYGMGTGEEVPMGLIYRLVSEGILVPAFKNTDIHAWILK